MPLPDPVASIYTYPWDLHDEIADHALTNIRDNAGLNTVALATSYHVSTYFLPHNPRRTVYYGEDGMVLFHPRQSPYADTKIVPRVSEVVDGGDYYLCLVEAIRRHGLGYCAWMVYAFNHHLPAQHPDAARVDALGNPYAMQLCVANPDVRAYFRGLTADVLAQFRPDSMHLESLSYLHWQYGFRNPKVFEVVAPRDQLLLGLCFCEHCRRAAGDHGDALRAAVAGHLRESLPREPTDAEQDPVSPEWLANAFGGGLARYLAARTETATSLYLEIAELCHAAGTLVESGFASAGGRPQTGLDPARVNAATDFFTVGGGGLAATLGRLPPGGRALVSYQPADMDATLPAVTQAARDAGAGGFTFYNYGLVRQSRLEWIGKSRAAWAPA